MTQIEVIFCKLEPTLILLCEVVISEIEMGELKFLLSTLTFLIVLLGKLPLVMITAVHCAEV